MIRPRPKVTVVGSLNIDLVSRAPRYPQQGETLIGDAFDIFTGGKGFNQATAAARLGADVTLIGCVGTDSFGEMLLSAMSAEQIDGRIKRAEVGTGVATIVVEPNGENSIIVVQRANMALTPADIEEAAPCIAEAEVLLLQLETPIAASERAAEIAKANGTTVLLNPAPAQPLPDSFLAHVDIIVPNESEAALLTGMPVTNAEEAVSAARRLMTTAAATTAPGPVARGPVPRDRLAQTSPDSVARGPVPRGPAPGPVARGPVPRDRSAQTSPGSVARGPVPRDRSAQTSPGSVARGPVPRGSVPGPVARGPVPRDANLANTKIPAIVLTLGEHGALLLTAEISEVIPAVPVDVVDTTGAGDAFCGALATALASGESLREAVRFANVAGAAAVTTLGATPSMPTREQLKKI